MTMEEITREREYGAAADMVAEHLQSGLDVAMPNIGDVSIFATYPYLALLLRERGYRTAMLPGVTSFSAAAARLGLSLTERDTGVTILPGRKDVEEGLTMPGTKVFMKSGRGTQELLRLLEERGLSEKSCMVINCGLADEMLFHTLRDVPVDLEPGYFSLVIVKEQETERDGAARISFAERGGVAFAPDGTLTAPDGSC